MATDSVTIAVNLVQRSHEWAKRYVAQEDGRLRSRLRGRGLLEWCRSLMWREYVVGCHTTGKTLSLLPDDAQDPKLLLAPAPYPCGCRPSAVADLGSGTLLSPQQPALEPQGRRKR